MRYLTLSLLSALAACEARVELNDSGCLDCHRPARTGGLEQQHEPFALACVECHGGDPNGKTKEAAHVARADATGKLEDLPLAARLAVDAAYRRFRNPSELDAAPMTCGEATLACHGDKVRSLSLSVHATAVGVLEASALGAGLVAEPSRAVRAVQTEGEIPAGYTASLARFEPVRAPARTASADEFLAFALGKACTGCHVSLPGGTGLGRSQNLHNTGCAACHLVYAPDGKSQSEDPTADRESIGRPTRHEITSKIPDRQCESCHNRSLRIGTQFRGVREPTPEDETARALVRAEEPRHGKPGGFFIEDDDGGDAVDTVPADVHHARGMGCIDCHVGADVHGDGRLPTSAGHAIGIECQDCHGSFDAPARPREGRFLNSGGRPLTRLSLAGEKVMMRGALDGKEREVPQLVDLRENVTLRYAHSEARHGRLECYACHTAWMQNFYAVERRVDMRDMVAGPLGEGAPQAGSVTEAPLLVRRDRLHLALNQDGRFAPFMFDTGFLTVIVPCDTPMQPGCESGADGRRSRKLYDRYLPVRPNPLLELRPAVPHTVPPRGGVQPCESCHAREIELNPDRAAPVYGFGSGLVLRTGSATIAVDRYIDRDGAALVKFPRSGTGPMPLFNIQKALNYRVPNPLR